MDFLSIIKAVGGPLAAIVGGPAGLAIGGALKTVEALAPVIGPMIGVEPTPEAIEQAVKDRPAEVQAAVEKVSADPDALAKISTAIMALQAQEMQSARDADLKRIALGHWSANVQPILAAFIVALFGLTLGYVLRYGIQDNPVVTMLLGAMISEFRGVIAYYFGSSLGSKQKDETMKAMTMGRR